MLIQFRVRLAHPTSDSFRPSGHFRSKHFKLPMESNPDRILNVKKCLRRGLASVATFQTDAPRLSIVEPPESPSSAQTQLGRLSCANAIRRVFGNSGAGAPPQRIEDMSIQFRLKKLSISAINHKAMKKISQKQLTNHPRQLDVVVLCVYLLDGTRKSIDTEDVAVKCHEIAPGIFSWRKYPDQINLELVRVVLSNAKKHAYGELVSGSGREGWRLSSRGAEWVRANRHLLREGSLHIMSPRNAGSIDTVKKQREKMRIVSSAAWMSWKEKKPMSTRDARNLFRIDEYATGKMFDIKIVRLQSLFENDDEIVGFIRDAAKLILEEKERENES